MIELIFAIAAIGILVAIAAPKFNATRDDAAVTKAKSTIASIRSAISSEIQKKMMEGNYNPIGNLGGVVNGHDKPIFDYFNGDNSKKGTRVLEYPPHSCKAGERECWMRTGAKEYTYYFTPSVASQVGTTTVKFTLNNGRFECDSKNHAKACRVLER